MPSPPSRKGVIMPDRPVKLNWNLFRIVRKRPTEEPVEQEVMVTIEPPSPPVVEPMPSATPSRRIPAKDEPLAYCADCHDWTPMQWLPKAERGKKPEQWFQCEYCGGRKLTLRYVSMPEAMRRDAVMPRNG